MAMLIAASADKQHTHGNSVLSLRRKLGQLARRHKNLEIMTTEPVYLGDFADLANLRKPLSLFEARKWARANRQHPLLAPYFQPGGVRAHVDHIVPRRWGGLDHARNYMLMPDVVNSSFREYLDNDKLAYIGSTAARKAAAFCKYAREHMTKCSLFRDMPELPVAGLHVTSSSRASWKPARAGIGSSAPTAECVGCEEKTPGTWLNPSKSSEFGIDEEKRLWRVLLSKPSELGGLGEPELAQAKALLQQGSNKENERLAVELLCLAPALWHAEALYLLAGCVSAGRGVSCGNPELAFLLYTCALESAERSAQCSWPYLDSLWHAVEYLEGPEAKANFAEFKVSSDPGFYFKKLFGLMRGLEPQHQQQLLERSRQAPATSLLSKLAWREMWPSPGGFSISIKAMQLSVRMQRFALSIKGQEMLKLEDCRDDIIAFFSLGPTKYFWLDLRDVLSRWWLARTSAHVAVKIVWPKQVLNGPPVQVEQTRVLKVQQLRREYGHSKLELVPLDWASKHTEKERNLFKVWEKKCTQPVSDQQLEGFLFPARLTPSTARNVAEPFAQRLPDWGTLIRACFEQRDGERFTNWLARHMQCSPKHRSQVWLCLEGQVSLLLRQILVSFCQALGNRHVAIFQQVHEYKLSNKLEELQACKIAVLDGCPRRADDVVKWNNMFRCLANPTREFSGRCSNTSKPIILTNRSHVLLLPDELGQTPWTDKQLQAKGVAATTLRLAAAPPALEFPTDVAPTDDLSCYLQTYQLEALAPLPPEVKQDNIFGRYVPEFCRLVVTEERLPGMDKPSKEKAPHVFPILMGKNKGFYVIQNVSIIASFESFLGLGRGDLGKAGKDKFWASMKQRFPRLDLSSKNKSMYSALGRAGPQVKGILFPYTALELYPQASIIGEKQAMPPSERRKLKRKLREAGP